MKQEASKLEIAFAIFLCFAYVGMMVYQLLISKTMLGPF